MTPAVDLLQRQRRFLDASVLRRNPGPAWHTPHQVALEEDAFRLRVFEPKHPTSDVPLLIVPPEVNRSHIVDFCPGQSLVQTALDAGFPNVAVVDWRTPRGRTRNRTVDDSLSTILDSIDALGGRAHLVGLCQGGWESAMVTARVPDAVASLTLAAAPIDFHAGDGVLKHVASAMPTALYTSMVAAGGGAMRGEFISTGFDNLLPFERYFLKWWRVWQQLDDDDAMERFHRLEDWYRCPKDLPGPMYLRAVRELFKENRLVQGRFVALGAPVQLSEIRCPLALIMGSRDHITPPAQTRAVLDHVSSEEVLEKEIPAGHVGTFMGKGPLRDHWPGVLDWLVSADVGRYGDHPVD